MPFTSSSYGLLGARLTLAEMLHHQGYGTYGFTGANAHLSPYFGYDRGFDRLSDFLEYNADPAVLRRLERDSRFGRNLPRLRAWSQRLLSRLTKTVRSLPPAEALAERTGRLWRPLVETLWHSNNSRLKRRQEEASWREVLNWFREAHPEPFFLWVHVMTAHEPYCSSAENQVAVNGRAISGGRAVQLRRMMAAVNQGRSGKPDDRAVPDLVALYDAAVRETDDHLGRLLARLEERGWLDPSLIIVTADHGEQLMDHGYSQHPAFHYDEQLRVPLLIRLPGQRRGRRIRHQVGLIDLMPTVADLLDIPLPEGACEGSSFAELLRGTAPPEHPERFYVSESFYSRHYVAHSLDWHNLQSTPRRVSFQNNSLKLIVDCRSGKAQAFDLSRDPREERDLTGRRPELARLARSLARCHVRRSERVRAGKTIRRKQGPYPRPGSRPPHVP
jgi:arylsulfatase A-like enzyme